MPLRPKMCVIIAFSMRLGVLPATFVRLVFYNDSVRHGDDMYDRALVEILTQVAMHLSIILTTLPCAKPFFVIFEGGVFRSPHDQNIQRQQRDVPLELTITTLPIVHGADAARRTTLPALPAVPTLPTDGRDCCSPQADERTQKVAERPTWDRRATFAKPSKSRLSPERPILKKKPSIKLNPLSWNRRTTFAAPTPPPAAYSAYFHKPSTSTTSTGTRRTSLPLYNRIIRPYHRQKPSDSSGSPSSWSRRSSEAYWGHGLRPDEGETITVISADSEGTTRRAELLREESRDSIQDAMSRSSYGGIEQKKEVVVKYDPRGGSGGYHGKRLQKANPLTDW